MGLPSIHANNRTNLTRSNLPKKTIDDFSKGKYLVNEINIVDQHPQSMDLEGDIPMHDISNEQEIELVSRYLASQRNNHQNFQPEISDAYLDNIVSNIPTTTKTIFVTDTNFIISHLSTLERLRQLAPNLHHQIIIPNTVIKELDGLKNSDREASWSSNGENYVHSIGMLARWANDWIYKNLANQDSGVMGQKLKQRIDPTCTKDDAILDCCLFFKDEQNCFVILLSNDKNLCLKALTEEIPTVSYRQDMTAELIASKAYEENLLRFGQQHIYDQGSSTSAQGHDLMDINMGHDIDENESVSPLDIQEVSTFIYEEVRKLMRSSIDYVMNEVYGEDIELIDYSFDRINSLRDSSKCLYKFWLSVFLDYFKSSKLRKDSWKDLPDCLLEAPINKKDLTIFFQFWQEIIRHLCSKRDINTKNWLDSELKNWKGLIKRAQ
ncbi:hypothetical protein Kpol_1037p41 [Vanderwaltozyma polyspora DSM 70294]|uniref:Transcriptional protein SWT1 n=1 Tax=Vanderwaltozyma polyspora (strain ATCC 22028 / DSM 70294 / BCRC 21397 / CBS 2163 / NBRC 10782 / NRRL Y-8283 / UCD 57-17) TaxID=436907 RepID=A7TJY2_VANPO|nr:uncharacterized protein Kpol_1037p41 [Vanderwaltozyma polyspora DSM 70294]EDO17444.1 hypothetical protein Kpol_1037p41 [Vanderwaltozyma polyspora DSM 70294]